MASTTVNSTGFDLNSVMNAKAVSSSKKATDTTQDFSAVLSNTTGNSNSSQNLQDNDVKSTTKSSETDSKAATTETEDSVKTDVKDVDNANDQAQEQPTRKEEEVDDTVIEEIATALDIILNQVKELLGADDETISVTMDDMGLEMGDLLNSDNLAQFVAAISGEDSAISLVTDEDLYSKLQSLTELVDTQFETVLENTGLSEDEIGAILENFTVEESPQETISNDASVANVDESIPDEAVMPSTEQTRDEPIVIVQNNTTTKNTTAYDKLADSQQEQIANLNSDSQSSDTKTEKSKDSQSDERNYSQNQGYGQNQETQLNENVTELNETTESFTSDNTESIMRQLADSIKLIKDDNMTQMELQLHPASLGTVNVNLITKGGLVTAQFTTQSEQVRAAIESQVAVLQQDLENQGVKVEAIEVTVDSHELEKNLDEDNSRREKEGEQAEESLQAIRRSNINLRDLGEDGDVLEQIQGADDATRIAMELMSANGNTMDLLT